MRQLEFVNFNAAHVSGEKRPSSNLQFISVDAGSASNRTLSEELRFQVRRQAMRKYLEGRSSGKEKEKEKDKLKTEKSHSVRTKTLKIQTTKPVEFPVGSPLTPISPIGYEAVRSRYGLDIRELSAFADVDVAMFTFHLFQADPQRIAKFFIYPIGPADTYMTHLPSWYGTTKCLDDAVECVTAVCSEVLRFGKSGDNLLKWKLYGKALKSLQDAITDPVIRADSSVLAASQLLSIFELLNGNDRARWNQHIIGMSRLIALQGPDHHRSDFGKTLVRGQVMTIAVESFLREKPCFFDSPDWQAYFLDMSESESFLGHSSWWSLAALVVHLPRMVSQTSAAFSGTMTFEKAYANSKTALSSFVTWLRHHCRQMTSRNLECIPHDILTMLKDEPLDENLLPLFVGSLVVLLRSIVALTTNAQERQRTEADAQELCSKRMEWNAETLRRYAAEGKDHALRLLLEQRNVIPHSIVASYSQWGPELREYEKMGSLTSEDWRNIMRPRWQSWCFDYKMRALQQDFASHDISGSEMDDIQAYIGCSSFHKTLKDPKTSQRSDLRGPQE